VKLLYLLLLAALCSPLGCNTGLPAYQKPELLYIQQDKYESIHVEVDIVQGCSPGHEPLERLREFLLAHCDKPLGVTMVESDIPRDEVAGLSPAAIALRNMQGPTQGAQRAAYMYVLFYDSNLIDSKRRFPYVQSDYPCAMFIDQSNLGRSDLNTHVLIHEAGHLLGVSKRPGRQKGSHCPDPACVMHYRVSPASVERNMELALAVDPNAGPLDAAAFCDDCLAEIARAAKARPARDITWLGPAMIRRESQYLVAMLPDFIGVFIQPEITFSRDRLMQAAMQAAATGGKSAMAFAPANRSRSTTAAIAAATRDPSPKVRQAVARLR